MLTKSPPFHTDFLFTWGKITKIFRPSVGSLPGSPYCGKPGSCGSKTAWLPCDGVYPSGRARGIIRPPPEPSQPRERTELSAGARKRSNLRGRARDRPAGRCSNFPGAQLDVAPLAPAAGRPRRVTCKRRSDGVRPAQQPAPSHASKPAYSENPTGPFPAPRAC